MIHNVRPTIVIMAGGTGGHIFPALAAAQELRERGFQIHWLGTPGSMEAELVPKHGFDISFLPVTGLRGKGAGYLLKAPWRISVSILRAVKALKQKRPVCVLGMGGYVTGPGGLAARLLGIPLVIHEQNAIAGLTNKVLSKISSRVLEAFPGTFDKTSVSESKVAHTGNPVRNDIQQRVQPRPESDNEPLRLLVFGGSRGALVLNQLLPEVLGSLASEKAEEPDHQSIVVWHQTGKGNREETQQLYDQHGFTGRIDEFIDDMAEAYDWADLIICRSGALTVSELAIAGRASLLVPYPFAVDDHQTANGQYLVDQNAAIMIQQPLLSKDRLVDILRTFIKDRSELVRMAGAARSIAMPDATRRVADHCQEVANVS